MKTTDFSNPMYDAIGTIDSGNNVTFKKNNIDNNGTSNYLHDNNELYEDKTSLSHPLDESYSNKYSSAILSPSSVIHKSSPPQIPIRQTALNPTSIDTDKDTAHLVEEDKTD